MSTYEFADVRETSVVDQLGDNRVQLEYVATQRFPTAAVHTSAICSTHTELQAYIEYFLYTKVSKQLYTNLKIADSCPLPKSKEQSLSPHSK